MIRANENFVNQSPSNSSPPPRCMAIVSGKGGSGKTMVAAEIARILDTLGLKVVIMDADTGTAGMTYYLGIRCAPNTSVGLANILTDTPIKESSTTQYGLHEDLNYDDILQPLSNFTHAKLFGMGDQRLLLLRPKRGRSFVERRFEEKVPEIIKYLNQFGYWVIIDCRGGIDSESLSVCQAVDDILLIAETDATSFQATQYLVQALSKNNVVLKLRGFFINKAINDPSQIAMNMTSSYKCKYLSSIPFDLRAVKAFLVGEIPPAGSIFGIQVWQGLHNLFPDFIPPPPFRPWDAEDFKNVGIADLDSIRGGMVTAVLGVMTATTLLSVGSLKPEYLSNTTTLYSIFVFLIATTLIASIESTRRLVGRLLTIYVRAMRRMLSLLFVGKDWSQPPLWARSEEKDWARDRS